MNSFGRIFRINIYGESHGPEIGIIIDGCPPGIKIDYNKFVDDIKRRSPGKTGTTSRIEQDHPVFKSGVYKEYTTGSPIAIAFENSNTISKDYLFEGFHRPGHADFTSSIKSNGFNNPLGSGHFSGRLTLPLVAAGVLAKQIIADISIKAKIIEAGGNRNIKEAINKAIEENDSIGGLIECRVNNIPAGLGEPFFDSIESNISHLAFAIPGLKAIEFGEGVKSASSNGSQFNDPYIDLEGKTKTNNSGGINGGITNGNEMYFRLYFKPPSSILRSQKTMNFKSGYIEEFKISGRHDACYALRVPVVVEAITAIALADFFLINKAY